MSDPESIPLVDLKAQYAEIAREVDAAVHSVMANADFILGSEVEAFESEFAAYCDAAFGVGVDSGLSALELGMRALGIGPGDEVITPAHSFIASSSAVSFTGATPVWVDVDPVTYNIAPDQIEQAITPKTKAIMAVHLYGQPADMDPILELAHRRNVYVIEDSCQAHGARYHGRKAGSMGDFAAFSFYPAKNLGAAGDAGILVTGNPDLASTVRMMRNYGQRSKYEHVLMAWNRRLDTIQAAVLRVKLPHLDAWNAARRRHAAVYDSLLTNCHIDLPRIGSGRDHAFHLYVIQADHRDDLRRHLDENGVHTGVHYPHPIHLQHAYAFAGKGTGSYPVSERLSSRVLSLPMYPELRPDQLQRVAEAAVLYQAPEGVKG